MTLTIHFLGIGLCSFLTQTHLAPPASISDSENLKKIEGQISSWNQIYPKDLLDFFRRETLLVSNSNFGKGILRGLKSWELAQELGNMDQWHEKGWLSNDEIARARQASQFLKDVQAVINHSANTITQPLQRQLTESPFLMKYFLEGQPLAEFSDKEDYEKISEFMRYLRKEELFLWLVSKKILRKAWAEKRPDSLKEIVTSLPELPSDLAPFKIVERQGVFFDPKHGLAFGYRRELDYAVSDEQVSLEEFLRRDPVLMLRLFQVSLERQIPLSDPILETIHQVAPLFKSVLSDEKQTKRAYGLLEQILRFPTSSQTLIPMLVLDLLTALIPEFEKSNALAVFDDTEHLYTVDAHTLQALRFLEQIELASSELVSHSQKEFEYTLHLINLRNAHPNPQVLQMLYLYDVFTYSIRNLYQRDGPLRLKLGVLLHDIGKPTYGKMNHDFMGAHESAPKVFRRFPNLDYETKKEIQWLIENDQRLWQVPSYDVLEDYLTALQLVEEVKGKTWLVEALAILSYVDGKAVQLLPDQDLMYRGLDSIAYLCDVLIRQEEDPQFSYEEWVEQERKGLEKRLKDYFLRKGIYEQIEPTIRSYLRIMPLRGMMGRDVSRIAQEIQLLQRVKDQKDPHSLLMTVTSIGNRQVEILVLHARDSPGLLAAITGVFALHDIDIRSSEIHTGSEGEVLNRFLVEVEANEWHRIEDYKQRVQFEQELIQESLRVIRGEMSVRQLFAEKGKPYSFPSKQRALGLVPPGQRPSEYLVPTQVSFGDFTREDGRKGTTITITTNDRKKGLIYFISEVLYKVFGANIQRAPDVVTVGWEAQDRFDVDIQGEPLKDGVRLRLKRIFTHHLMRDPLEPPFIGIPELEESSLKSETALQRSLLAPAANMPQSIIEREGMRQGKKEKSLVAMVGDRGPEPQDSGKAIWFWNVATRQFVGEGLNLPKGKEDPLGVIWDISMAERGERLAALMSSGTVLTWGLQETKTGELIGKHPHPQFLDHPFRRVESLAISPDGHFIAIKGSLVNQAGMTAERKIRVWELDTYKVTGRVSYHRMNEVSIGHSSGEEKLAFSPDGKLVLVNHHTIRLWNVPDLQPLASFPCEFTDGLKNISISHDGRFLMVEQTQGPIQFVSLSDFTVSDVDLNESTDTIVTLAFGPDRSLSFMSQGQDARVVSYRKLVTGKFLEIPHLNSPLISPDGLHLATVKRPTPDDWLEQYVYLWELSHDFQQDGIVDKHLGSLPFTLTPNKLKAPFGSGIITTISFEADGKFIAVATSVGEVSFWNLQDLNKLVAYPRWGLKDMGYGIRSIAISKNADLLVACDFEKGIVEVFEVEKILPHYVVAKPLQTLKHPKPPPGKPNIKARRVAIRPDGRFVFGDCDDGKVRFWDRQRGTDVAGEELIVSGELPYGVTEVLGEVTSLAFSSDGTQLALGGKGKIQIWYLQTDGVTGEEAFRLLQTITLYKDNFMSITSKPPGAPRLDTMWLLEPSFVSHLHSYHDDLATSSSL